MFAKPIILYAMFSPNSQVLLQALLTEAAVYNVSARATGFGDGNAKLTTWFCK